MNLLTKSKYMNGLQCPRLLWFANKKLLPEPSLADQHKFNQGFEFETQVKKLFPEGIDLKGLDFKENLNQTQANLNNTIFEAGIMTNNLFIRADILENDNLYEIKSTTQVKPQHYDDLAFQKYVLNKANIKINKCYLIHLNKEYIKQGEIDPKQLAIIEDVTENVDLIDVEQNIAVFQEIMNLPEPPICDISQQCNKPYTCPLYPECSKDLPEYNVLQLTNWRVYWDLIKKGITDIKDIPPDTKLTPKDLIIIESLKHSPVIAKEHIKHFLDSLDYPLYHFDFETFDTAVPIFNKTRPYQKLPFQYSLHIEQEDGTIVHKEFLSEGGDPRPALLKQMKEDLKGSGNIVTYNKSFEISVMKQLLKDFPEETWISDVIERIIDLADPFRAFYWYDKSQKGSYSIKKVLPAVTGKSYKDLEIGNGGDASSQYFYSHIVPKLENKDEIRANLIKYCNLDTEGMVWILGELKNE